MVVLGWGQFLVSEVPLYGRVGSCAQRGEAGQRVRGAHIGGDEKGPVSRETSDYEKHVSCGVFTLGLPNHVGI